MKNSSRYTPITWGAPAVGWGCTRTWPTGPSRAPGMPRWSCFGTKYPLLLKFTYKTMVNVSVYTSTKLATLKMLDFNQKDLTQTAMSSFQGSSLRRNWAYSSLSIWWKFGMNTRLHNGFRMGSPEHFMNVFAAGDGWNHVPLVRILTLIFCLHVNHCQNIMPSKLQRKWGTTFCFIKQNSNFM